MKGKQQNLNNSKIKQKNIEAAMRQTIMLQAS
jgi:hypothetical protein